MTEIGGNDRGLWSADKKRAPIDLRAVAPIEQHPGLAVGGRDRAHLAKGLMLEIDHRVIAIRGDVSATSKIHLTGVFFAINRLKRPIDIGNRATHQVQILGDYRCGERDDQSHAGLLVSDPSSGGQNFQTRLVHRGPWSSGLADQAILAPVNLHPGK